MFLIVTPDDALVACVEAVAVEADRLHGDGIDYPFAVGIAAEPIEVTFTRPTDWPARPYRVERGPPVSLVPTAPALPPPPPPPPPRPGPLTPFQFKTLFAPSERIAIRASINPVVIDVMDLLNSAVAIDLGDPTTVTGIDLLVASGLLTAERGAAVKAGVPPSLT
jgi:hypothetical protein